MKIKNIKITAKNEEYPIELFDKNGNKIYYELISGYWNAREYDSNGNQIYYEDSSKDWWKREFDSNGNQIYFENSDDKWFKREFDSSGNEIYFENSQDGIVIDKRPKPAKELTVSEISELLGYEVKVVK